MAKQNLPHTRNSEAGANMYELVVGSQFKAYLLPPSSVTGGAILTQHAKKITGFFVEKGGDSVVTQTFETAARSYDSNEKETYYDIEIDFSMNLNDANQNYVFKTLQQWSRLKYNPLTGERGIKKDYVGTIVGEKYRRDGAIFWRRAGHQAFVASNLEGLDGDYSSHDPQELTVKFRADYVTDEDV